MLTQLTNTNLNKLLWSSINKYLTFYQSFIYLLIDNKRKKKNPSNKKNRGKKS